MSEVFTKAKQKLDYHEDDGIAVDGVLNISHPPNVIRCVIPIDSQLEWENYVTSTMKTQLIVPLKTTIVLWMTCQACLTLNLALI